MKSIITGLITTLLFLCNLNLFSGTINKKNIDIIKGGFTKRIEYSSIYKLGKIGPKIKTILSTKLYDDKGNPIMVWSGPTFLGGSSFI